MSGHFAAALTRLEAAIFALSPRLPPEAPTVRMVRNLSAADAAPKEPQPAILEGVRRRLRQVLSSGGQPVSKDLKQAPWILWQGEPPAISFPGLLDMVVAQAMRSPRALRYLIEAWLRDFSPKNPGITSAGFAIQQLLADGHDARLEAWRAAHSRFRLFDAADGPAALAAAILDHTQSVSAVMEAAGFADESRRISAYLRAVQTVLLARLPAALQRANAQKHCARACEFLISGRQLRFDDTHAAIAHALCEPWFNTSYSAAMELQRQVQDFLIEQLGNPQLRPGRWVGAEREAALIRRWLARASLKVFFGLIADYALDTQWTYREAFWSACLRKGVIDDAWLVLGANVHASARARQGLGGAFAKLDGAGATGDQSVLLLRIGPLLIAEWSHNGSMRAWLADQAPKVGRSSYLRSDLVRSCLPFPADSLRPGARDASTSGLRHAGSATGVWQRRAALLLAHHANVRVQPADWRPR